MARPSINTGILTNANSLLPTQIKAIENDVLETNTCVAYLDEEEKLCFATAADSVEGIKHYAWNTAYEIAQEEDAFVKRAYKKDSLWSYYLYKQLQKKSIDDEWAEEAPVLAAGLYDANDTLVASWDELVQSGAIVVDNGSVSSGLATPHNMPEKNEYGFYYGVPYWDALGGSGFVFYEDGSVDSYYQYELSETAPAGTAVYSNRLIELPTYMQSLPVSEDGCTVGDFWPTYQLGELPAFDGDLIMSCDSDITNIGDYAFASKKMVDVTIPEGVVNIGERAFADCSSLNRVVLPDSLTSIGISAFDTCSALININIPNSVTFIGSTALFACTSLTNITFEGTVEQWNAVTKGTSWNSRAPATYVQCSDGQVTL